MIPTPTITWLATSVAIWKLQAGRKPPSGIFVTRASGSMVETRSFLQECAAIQAALTTPWSTGQYEGQICRLKLIKRVGYGRAKPDLLRQRVLHRLAVSEPSHGALGGD